MISPMKAEVAEVIDAHSAAGRRFIAGGVRSFVRDHGAGPVVVCVHGVPTSSFMYRRLLAQLADQGLRGVAFDFPGLGLADRPAPFDYSWTGLATWMGEAIDALELDRVHLVVHDIGGPIGAEWAIRNPERTLSVTFLNTMLDPATFRRPWTMAPFAIRGLGELWLWTTPAPLFAFLFRLQGLADRGAMTKAEIYAYLDLLQRVDGGRAFLRVMRSFELTEAKRDFLWDGFSERRWPARIVWGERDPALGPDQLEIARRALGVDDPVLVPAKHFLPEEQAIEIANVVADVAAPLG